MYYVNEQQIEVRLAYTSRLCEAAKQLIDNWEGTNLQALAQERILHLAIEIITDVGSYLIDGFIMRDASSYEDIVEITAGEGVYPDSLKSFLLEIVQLRKALVQEYFEWKQAELHPLMQQLPDALQLFSSSVKQYLEAELK